MNISGVRRFGRRGDALGRLGDVVKPMLAWVPVLDRAAGEAGVEREAHGLCDAGGVHREALLEVRRHRHVGSGRKRGGVGERLLAGNAVIETPEARGVAAAGGGEGLIAERGK